MYVEDRISDQDQQLLLLTDRCHLQYFYLGFIREEES